MNGLNLPSDEEIARLAAQAGFAVGARVHVRNAPAYTAAPIREFTWSAGHVMAVWMGGACRTPLSELVLAAEQQPTAAQTVAAWQRDLCQAEQEHGIEPAGSGNDDWLPCTATDATVAL